MSKKTELIFGTNVRFLIVETPFNNHCVAHLILNYLKTYPVHIIRMINKFASFHPYLQVLRMHRTENKYETNKWII